MSERTTLSEASPSLLGPLRVLQIRWSCLDGHEHETEEQAAQCIGDRLTSAIRETVEIERAGQ